MLDAVFVIGGVGFLAALVLGIAAVTFAVKPDPKEAEVLDLLPGANCGACGYAGCAAFAHALVQDPDTPMACTAVDADTAQRISSLLGRELDVAGPMVASIRCMGSRDRAGSRFSYVGPMDCRAAHLVAGGYKACGYGCLGLGTCEAVCPFDAIHMGADGLPEVVLERCTGCGTCVDACPRGIIRLVPKDALVEVRCVSLDSPKVMKGACDIGCIKCMLCVNVCPFDAIDVSDNGRPPVIDQDKCHRCSLCVDVCPRGVIDIYRVPQKVRIVEDRCIGCSICEQVCPFDAISGEPKGVYVVDLDRCRGCGLCVEKCPKDAIVRVGDA